MSERDVAALFLSRWRSLAPQDFAPLHRPGYRRGIDVYDPSQLPQVLARALASFAAVHGRAPDPVGLPRTADHFFRMKFLAPVPVRPNPASKLDCGLYIPGHLAGTVRTPLRPWISVEPRLPADAEVAPGPYWLKLEFGNANHLRLSWPPSREERAAIEQRLSGHMIRRFGPGHGEWWYGIGQQRAYLEEDLSGLIAGGMELKIYVRRGRAVAGYMVRYSGSDGRPAARIGFFDAAGRARGGSLRLGARQRFYTPEPFVPPLRFASIMAAAAAIGAPFDLVRVDLLTGKCGEIYLGELSLCHGNATVVFAPDALEDELRRLLFGPEDALIE